MKKLVALLLTALMVVSVFPITVFAVTGEKYHTLTNGTVISFGTYPQSKVTDDAITDALTEKAGNTDDWTSYDYYFGSTERDLMKYTDVELDGEKYRGVYFTSYRPYNISNSSSSVYSNQDDNGYLINNIYWFKYEPLNWTVLDEKTGLFVSNLALDSQEYNNYSSLTTIDEKTVYSNNWEYSVIRNRLNDNFFNTAFNTDEQELISETKLENKAYNTLYSRYDGSDTTDKVFLLSYSEANYYWSSTADRKATSTDYAKCQGVQKSASTGTSNYRLRTAGNNNGTASYIDDGGEVIHSADVKITSMGIRPALCLNLSSSDLESEIVIWEKTGAPATCTTDGVYTHTNPVTKEQFSSTKTKYGHLDKDENGYCERCQAACDFSKLLPSFTNGSSYTLGTYPQSKVTDDTITNALTEKAGSTDDWTSYDYYFGSTERDLMKYTDVEFDGEKYRGVFFTSYRPNRISSASDASRSYQDDNGYLINNIYWFKYEPINWTVLDEKTGLAISNRVLDAQEFYEDEYNRTIDGHTIYANNWEYSNIRNWLNDNFYNTAFTESERELISATTLENKAYSTYYSKYNANNTTDKVFALSFTEASQYQSGNTDQKANNTDYAKCQGLYSSLGYNAYYWLRSAGSSAYYACYVGYDGTIYNSNYYLYETRIGVRPALYLNLSASIFKAENNFVYYVFDEKAHIVSYSDTEATEVTIPATLGGYPVDSIGASTFTDCSNLSKVIIPDSVTAINDCAFENCELLNEITIGNSVTTIGENAFGNCVALKTVTIPQSVTSISATAFSGCTGIEEFTVSAENEKYYSDINGIILNKADNSCVIMPINKKNVEIYKDFNTSILSQFPALETVNIAADVEEIEDGTFKELKTLQAFTVDEDNETFSAEDGVLYSSTKRRLYCYPAGKTDKAYTFSDKVARCSPYAFYGNAYLEVLDIPSTISIIDEYTFANCTAIREITIPESVVSIGSYAFSGATALTQINWNAANLTASLQGVCIFKNCGTKADGITITFGRNVSVIPAYMFSNSGANLQVIEAESIATVGTYAFNNCTALTDVKFGSQMTSFGSYCFQNCSAIKNVYIGDIEKWISASFGAMVSNPLYFAEYLYVDGELYKDLVIDSTEAVTVSNYAFQHFDGLSSVSLNGSKVTINQYAFDECDDIESVTIESTSTATIANFAFRNIFALKNVDIQATGVTIGQYCFNACKNLENFNMSDATGTIGKCAFASCASLTAVRIGNGISNVGESAFADCISLPVIIVPVSTTKVNSNAFSGCKKLKEIYVMNADCISTDSVQNTIYKNTVIYSHEGGSVEAYADFFGFDFVSIHIGDGEYYTSAKCTEPGEQYQKCKYCDEIANTSDVPALGHSFTKYVPDGNATCTKDGTKTAKCDRCDATETVADTGSKTEHEWNDGVVTTAPTTEKEGVKTYTCTVCGNTKTEKVEKLSLIKIETENVVETDGGLAFGNAGTSVAEILNAVPGSKITTKDGKEAAADSKLCNGMTVTKPDGTTVTVIVMGDVDCDGTISVSDARLALRAAIGLEKYGKDGAEFKSAAIGSADAANADAVTVADARLILRAAINLDNPKAWTKK